MVHKLLIEFVNEPDKILTNREYDITIKITNIGNSIFPGGKFNKFSYNFTKGPATQHLMTDRFPEIPSIMISGSYEFSPNNFYAFHEGLVWLYIEIKANDEEKIEYYRSRGDRAREDEWVYGFNILKAEEEEKVVLLKEILEQLKTLTALFLEEKKDE